MKRCQRMSDQLVERGFATQAMFNDNSRMFKVTWTKRGAALQTMLKSLFKESSPGQDVDGADIVAMICLILKTGSKE